MRRPSHVPPETHCRNCGTRLEAEHPVRDRVRSLLDRRSWQARVVCPGCGAKSSGGWGGRTWVGRHPPRNPFLRLPFRLKHRRGTASAMAEMGRFPPHLSPDGRVDLAVLVATVPFPVYGLKGRPLGLRLMRPGAGSGGNPQSIDSVHFGYVAGHPRQPEQTVYIDQGSGVENPREELKAFEELSRITSLVYNYPPKARKSYFYQGDFHRGWNLERLRQTPHRQIAIQIGGKGVAVDLVSWEEPQRVILARLILGEHPLLAASLNASQEELLKALSTQVVLQEDQQALADLQWDVDEVRQQLREYHDKYLT